MLTADFDYELPEALIAQAPPPRRRDARLLVVDARAGAPHDHAITDLPALLAPGDLLVFNDTRVVPARLHGRKPTGARVEVLVERRLDAHRAIAWVRANRTPSAGARLEVADGVGVTVEGRDGERFVVRFDTPVDAVLERAGSLPLPPYIRRAPDASDLERYQTVYARAPGSAAAPTAGLHFDEALLDALAARGIERAFVTLHVGAGTFAPVRTETVEAHRLHREWLSVPATTCDEVAAARARGGRVVAVGTTAVRALESAAADGGAPVPFEGETGLYIYPGYPFRAIDGLVTNFHLPRSSLLMLVCAFGGRERVLDAYAAAVARRYRFFSYGDAMLLWPEAPGR